MTACVTSRPRDRHWPRAVGPQAQADSPLCIPRAPPCSLGNAEALSLELSVFRTFLLFRTRGQNTKIGANHPHSRYVSPPVGYNLKTRSLK